jgi:glycosyltransferase involved in cell wall biosynthesis
VLFIKQSTAQVKEETVLNEHVALTEQIIYLPKKSGSLGKWQSLWQWRQVTRSAAEAFIRKKQPSLIHVHVPWKAGMLALWIKRKFNIPFILTEHWGIYNNVVADNIHTRTFLFRTLLKRVYKEAGLFASVSRYLAEGVNKTLVQKSYTVIPNVVDTNLFHPSEKSSRFTFLHVSNMVPLKNVQGILVAFKHFLTETGENAQLVLVGNRDQYYVQLAGEMGFPNGTVVFRGEIPYAGVAREMRQAHVLVLNSDMENSPCVIGEALCCGLPVIATRVGGIPELVSSKDGLLVPPRDITSLAVAFTKMFYGCSDFQGSEIAVAAQSRFSYESVGLQLHQLYQG